MRPFWDWGGWRSVEAWRCSPSKPLAGGQSATICCKPACRSFAATQSSPKRARSALIMLKRALIIIVGFVLITTVYVCVFLYIDGKNTRYSNPLVKENFIRVDYGISIDEVYRLIGSPFFLYINTNRSGGGTYHLVADANIDPIHVKQLTENTNLEVHMVYTTAFDDRRDYKQYTILIQEGKVKWRLHAGRMQTFESMKADRK
jgi:hypothetical protein